MRDHDIRREIMLSLPKHTEKGKLYWLHIVGSISSIIGLVAAPIFVYVNQGWECIIVATALSLFAFASLILSARTLIRSRYRYANVVHFFHYVNHIMRDYIATMIREGTTTPLIHEHTSHLDEELQNIVTAIADCFWVVTGQRCRCCIKALETKTSPQSSQPLCVRTIARDKVSVLHSHDDSVSHAIVNNTDFCNLMYPTQQYHRGYVANNIPALFLQRAYNNTSIPKDYQPNVNYFQRIRNWPLPYRSTLVVPIRYISVFLPPKEREEAIPSHWTYWGFLCIDSNHNNVFLDPDLLELAGGFADGIYSFISTVEQFGKIYSQSRQKT